MEFKNYTLIKEEEIKEVNGIGMLLEHDKTKARVMLIKNDDKNKVFMIGFRTPPKNDTGIAHITEHSVLCGSRKFPVKDPFVELAKGSLNTFLNAMTYPDKTVYPIASVNDKDFHNLLDVYMDAVFYPNTYKNDKIMRQEGWHYEMESEDDDITINGVVYNEMKGVYSSADSQLAQTIEKALYPDNTYSKDSGGDPTFIPELTQEEFLDFHRNYYHPSNSYIYLYGDVDFEKELEFIHEEYLKDFDEKKVDSEIPLQKLFDEKKDITIDYPLSDEEDDEDRTYLSYSTLVGESNDRVLNLSFMMLDYALVDVPGAPLRKALIDAGIGNDVYSSYEDSVRQPSYSILAKDCNPEDKDKFVSIIEDTLTNICKEGFNERVLRAAINHFEFKLKEASFGRYPKGLMYGLASFNSWLYDDNAAFTYFRFDDEIEEIKSKVGTSYFTDIIDKYILNNPHKVIVTSKPKKGMNQEADKKLADKLAAFKASLSKEEITKIVNDTKELKEYQSIPSTQEELKTIPLLELSDIDKNAAKLKNDEINVEDVKVITHDIFTNGIAYIAYRFDLKHVSEELLPYVALLTMIYKDVDTKNYSYNDLANEIDLKTGGISFGTSAYAVPDEREYMVSMGVSLKVLNENVAEGLELLKEILFTSNVTDKKRLKEIIAENVSAMKQSIMDSGHLAMSGRAMSYLSKGPLAKEMMEGVSHFDFLMDINNNFDERYEEVCEKLKAALHALAKKENLIISYTGQEDLASEFSAAINNMAEYLNDDKSDVVEQNLTPVKLNEGFKTSGKVQYVATAGNYKNAGLEYTGSLNVLHMIFAYDYLWINVRVKGGAYGAMCSFTRTGDSYFTSYRDPNLAKTYEIYKAAADYVENFEADDRDMLKYIIGAIAKIDTPKTPAGEGAWSFSSYMAGITDEMIQKNRDDILSTNVEKIRSLAPYIREILKSDIICVLGDEQKIQDEASRFEKVRSL